MLTIEERYNAVKVVEPSITITDFFFEKVDNYNDLPEFLNTFAKISASPLPMVLWRNHRKKLLIRDYEQDLDAMQNDIMLALLINKYKIEGLYQSINFEYDPMANTDYKLKTKTTHGEQNRSETIGGRSDSVTVGSRTDTITEDGRTDTTTNYDTGMNSTDMKEKDSSEYEYADKVTNNTTGEQTNSNTIGSQNNTAKENSYIDEYEESKSGNIGITSSATLIREHRDIVDFNLWEKIAQIIVDEICLCIYREEC